MPPKRTVLITGCSEGGMGDALARAFNVRGLRVIATARSPSKTSHLKAHGIETLALDILSSESIAKCVSSVSDMTGGSLDILVNNAGGGYPIPLADADIEQGRKLFDLNVWSALAVTQAFLPLALKAEKGMIVNVTSLSAAVRSPYVGIYSASKCALSAISETLRTELAPFGVKVVDLRSGTVKTNFYTNLANGAQPKLPADSIYKPIKAEVETFLTGVEFHKSEVDRDTWAAQVVGDLLRSSPPARVWRGGDSWMIWFATSFLPLTFLDSMLEKMGSLDVLKKKLAAGGNGLKRD